MQRAFKTKRLHAFTIHTVGVEENMANARLKIRACLQELISEAIKQFVLSMANGVIVAVDV